MDKPYLATRIEVWNRQDCCQGLLSGAVISLINPYNDVLASWTTGNTTDVMQLQFAAFNTCFSTKIELKGAVDACAETPESTACREKKDVYGWPMNSCKYVIG